MSRLSIDCVLTESCNLRCEHCFQRHMLNNLPTIESLQTLLPLLNSVVDEEAAKKESLTQFDISYRGGEIFQDKIPDEVIKAYGDLTLDIKNKEIMQYIRFGVDFVSNGMFEKRERVLELLNRTNGQISISFDPVGRFTTDKQRELFETNAKYFAENGRLKTVDITLTKEAIYAYMNNPDLLEQISEYNIDISYFIPNKRSHSPTDDELFNFFKFLFEKSFYNFEYVKLMIDYARGTLQQIPRCCNCANTVVIYDGKVYKDCSILIPNWKKEDYYDDPSKAEGDNVVMKLTEQGINKRGCLSCEHYESCPMFCWMMLNHKNHVVGECPHKRIFDFIKNDPDILKDFSSNGEGEPDLVEEDNYDDIEV